MPTTNSKLTGREQVTRVVYWILRVVSVFYVLFLFLPSVNPARITLNINRNHSLLTSGFFYKVLTDGMGRGIQKGWMSQQALTIDFLASMACCIGAILAGFGGCAIALVKKSDFEDFKKEVEEKYYNKTNIKASVYLVDINDDSLKIN